MYHWLYYILLFSLIFGAIIFDFSPFKKQSKLAFNAYFLLLAFISTIRYGVGFDTLNYMTAFEYIPPVNQIDSIDFLRFRFQPLYTLLNSVCKYIYNDFFFFQIIHSAFFWYSFYSALEFLGIRKIYLLLLFYLQFYFNLPMAMFRECLAVSCFFLSIKYLINNKFITYYIIVTIAFFFHVSAIILYILPVLKQIFKVKSSTLLFIISFMPFFIPVSLKLANTFLLSFGLDSIMSYSERYYHSEAMAFSFNITNYIKNISLFLILYYLANKENRLHNYSIYAFFLIYLIIDMIAAMQIDMFFRFANYLFIFYYSVIDHFIFSETGKRSLKKIALFIILYQPINIHLAIFSNEYNNLLCPYASYFWGDKEHYNKEQPITVPDYILW